MQICICRPTLRHLLLYPGEFVAVNVDEECIMLLCTEIKRFMNVQRLTENTLVGPTEWNKGPEDH